MSKRSVDKVTSSLSINKEKYSSIDGLRAYAAIGIVLMHVLANIAVKPRNILTTTIIPYFTNFTLLFMMISAFSICCGYYERVKHGQIAPNEFYSKRYHRVLPFFALMVMIDVVMNPQWGVFCEAFANLTLCFNLLPNPHIEVVGVGWFIGTVFTFYIIFPFFTFLLDNIRRAWFVFLLSLIFCYIAIFYFGDANRVNIIYSAPFFVSGGLIYLNKKLIAAWVSKYSWVMLGICLLLSVLKFILSLPGFSILSDLILFSAWLMYAIGSHNVILNNRVTVYISKISLEIYLCHMMFYRVVAMLHLESLIKDVNLLYVIFSILTLGGAICFSHIVKFIVFPRLRIK